MVANINKLRGKIAENGLTINSFATEISMCEATLRRKMFKDGEFTIEESINVKDRLNLNLNEYMEIFYGSKLEYKSR